MLAGLCSVFPGYTIASLREASARELRALQVVARKMTEGA